jgi:hypothetical protein
LIDAPLSAGLVQSVWWCSLVVQTGIRSTRRMMLSALSRILRQIYLYATAWSLSSGQQAISMLDEMSTGLILILAGSNVAWSVLSCHSGSWPFKRPVDSEPLVQDSCAGHPCRRMPCPPAASEWTTSGVQRAQSGRVTVHLFAASPPLPDA